MTSIHADREAYALERRHVRKKGKKPLNGFALDITVRFNTHGVPFLEDHNGDLGTMPFHDVNELIGWLGERISTITTSTMRPPLRAKTVQARSRHR